VQQRFRPAVLGVVEALVDGEGKVAGRVEVAPSNHHRLEVFRFAAAVHRIQVKIQVVRGFK
jgi:hypothetical protein